jgi:hypothetical protein
VSTQEPSEESSSETEWQEEATSSLEDPDATKSKARRYSLIILALVGVGATIAAIFVPNILRAKARSRYMACRSNLKNLGVALEMYSVDRGGKYPTTLGQLTPNYLKTVPRCPSS